MINEANDHPRHATGIQHIQSKPERPHNASLPNIAQIDKIARKKFPLFVTLSKCGGRALKNRKTGLLYETNNRVEPQKDFFMDCNDIFRILTAKIVAAEEAVKQNNESIDKVKKEKAALDAQLKDFAVETNKLERLKSELRALREDWQAKKKQKKFDDKAKEEFKNKQRELNKKINEQEAEVQNLPIKKVEIEATQKKYKLEQLEGQVEKLDKELETRKTAYEMAQKDPNREGKVRDTSFSVSVKGVN